MRKLILLLACLMMATAMRAQRSDSAVVRFLRETYGVEFTDNNRICLFSKGQALFDDLFTAISQARESVHLEYFNFRNDSISEQLFRLLARKAAEGVEVRAIFDGWGNRSNNRPLKHRHLDSLRNVGIEIYQFDPIRFPWINHAFHRDHRKIVVIDGMVAYTGGMNVADYYIKGKPEFGEWRDLHLRIEGDAVAWLQSVFINFWNAITHQDLKGTKYYPGTRQPHLMYKGLCTDTTQTAGQKRVGVVNRDPQDSPKIIHDTFLQAINSARTNIHIISPYFVPCRHITKALRRAQKRGVRVQVMVSEKCDVPITPRVVDHNMKKLMRAGAEVYYFQGGFHHSKIMMVDSTYAFVGSANLNSRSLSFDYECNLLIADPHTTAELSRIFCKDMTERCYRLTPERWKKIPIRKRIAGWFGNLLTPFM